MTPQDSTEAHNTYIDWFASPGSFTKIDAATAIAGQKLFDDAITAVADLASAEAPATVVHDPQTNNLWMFWCAQDYNGKWYSRHTVAVAVSQDSGQTWGKPHTVEYDSARSFGYVSVLFMPTDVLLTYYDWKLSGTTIFHNTHLRQRTIPRAWLDARLS